MYGRPGAGKTYWAFRKFPEARIAINNKPFGDFIEGYDAGFHDVIVFNELDSSRWNVKERMERFRTFTTTCEPDINPLINIKGGSSRLTADVIIVTSLVTPFAAFRHVFTGRHAEEIKTFWDEVSRRISEVHHVWKVAQDQLGVVEYR